MKISTRGRYGVRILLDLARHAEGAPRLIREISSAEQISAKYISRLIIDLRRAGFVSSVRGARGGFLLAKDPAELTLLEIIETMEGPLSVVECVQMPESCERHDCCAPHAVWENLNAEIRAAMSRITLQEMLETTSVHAHDELNN